MPEETAGERNPVEDQTLGFKDFKYTAFQKWKYDRVFYSESGDKLWLDLSDSFFRASFVLIEGAAKNNLFEDVEGLAGVFLFRHYLELTLKHIIVAGRWLTEDGRNAPREAVLPVRRIHNLNQLWNMVLQDAKPKLPVDIWNNYDTEFVEQCIREFDTVDPNGFAFRYAGEGIERVHIHFRQLFSIMEHVHSVLGGIQTCLIETYGQNAEWESYLASEYSDYF